MWPGPRTTSVPSGILIHPGIWPQQIWAENWGGAVPLWGRESRVPSNTMWPGLRPTCIQSFILIHPAVWPQQTRAKNWGALTPFGKEGTWSHLTQCCLERGLPPYQVVSSSIQPFGHNTPTSQTERQTDNGPIAQGEPFYKQPPKNQTR